MLPTLQGTHRAGFRNAIREAAELLRPKLGKIGLNWRNLVQGLGLTDRGVELLADLNFSTEIAKLRAGRLEAYGASLKRKAHKLQRLGVPETSAVASLGCYLESCLPFITGDRAAEMIAALSHLTTSGQLFVMSGYGSQRALSRRKIEEDERHRLSRDLHDEVGHSFLVLKLYLEMMVNYVEKGKIAKIKLKLNDALTLVSQGIESVRRLILDLGPSLLDELGLIPALKMYTAQFEARTGIKVSLKHSNLSHNLSPPHATVAYRVIQGALSNVLKHSRASHVNITLTRARGPLIIVTIEDNGIGFDLTRLKTQQSFGLTAIRERSEGLGGRFHLESWQRGTKGRKHGTRIKVEIPPLEKERKSP